MITILNLLDTSYKLLGNTEADRANEILKSATIAMSLKYLSNCWRSLEIPFAK